LQAALAGPASCGNPLEDGKLSAMTDRHAGYLVTLAQDVREDDAEAIMTALRMVRGVTAVQPVTANVDQQIGQIRADGEWREKLFAFLRERHDG